MILQDFSPWLRQVTAASAVLLACTASAQRFDAPLSHGIDAREAAFYEANPYPTLLSRGETTPPEFDNLRTMAEWEEIEILCVGWEGYSAIEKQIVVNAAQECEVIVLTEDAGYVEDYITSNNNGGAAATMDNITILEVPLNTVWIRDYGPNTVYGNGVDDRIIVDWLYNRPRPEDDVAPQVIADHMGIDLYETTAEPYELMNTGGNFMSDGFGMGFASDLIGDENSGGSTWWGTQFPDHSAEDIEGILADFMGLHTYIRMENLPFDGIHHIDMHMKLLDEETILMAEYPAGLADGPQIEANLEYVLSNHTSKWGTPFDVVRIPSPPEPGWGGGFPDEGGDYMTYTNSVFVNNTILLPTYYEEYDTTAIAVYEKALPGYNVVGIDCNQIISASGAIHCITHSVGVEDPLLISHQPLDDTEDTENDYPVEALVQHRSGIEGARMFWRLEGETDYSEVAMASGMEDMWTAAIPAQPEGTVVQYYIEGTSVSGKVQDRPMPAPEGYWQFRVGEVLVNGIAEAPSFAGFQPAFPNPAAAITCVPVQLSARAKGRLVLRDAAGRLVLTLHEGPFAGGTSKYFLDAAPLTAGAYVLHLELEGRGTWSQRLMVR
ncbi:MAG: agmatine deiminase family protein [Flavobacteriales bacterium]|nr:agmatine deiminase family protein [Flavobacteriales bacterium]